MRLQMFRAPGFRFSFSSMAATPKSFLALTLSIACTISLGDVSPAVATPAAKDKKPKPDPALKGLPITELSVDEAILHALNRLAYGPRPGDVERIKQMGLAKWIDQQLNPNSLDDKALEARLENLPTLRMSTTALMADYPQPKPKQPPPPSRANAPASAIESRAQAGSVDIASDSTPGVSKGVGESAEGSSPATSSPMKQPSGNARTQGAGKRSTLSIDPNAVPRPIADDSKRPARV